MPFARCLSSLGCPGFSLEEMLALAARHGVPAVELRTLGGTVDLPAYLAQHYGAPAALAARLRDTSVRIAGFDASLHLVGTSAAEQEQLRALVPWAEAVGVGWIRVFDGGREADSPELTAAAATIAWWRRLRREHGWRVDLAVETHDSLFNAAAVGRFLAAVPDTPILWDAHHTWRKGGEDPVMTWRAIRSAVVHVHVKDSVDRPSARHPFTYVLPGEGGFPIGPLLTALRADGYPGLVSLEWEKMWHPYLPPLETALEAAGRRGWW